jgi:hypothetical protein
MRSINDGLTEPGKILLGTTPRLNTNHEPINESWAISNQFWSSSTQGMRGLIQSSIYCIDTNLIRAIRKQICREYQHLLYWVCKSNSVQPTQTNLSAGVDQFADNYIQVSYFILMQMMWKWNKAIQWNVEGELLRSIDRITRRERENKEEVAGLEEEQMSFWIWKSGRMFFIRQCSANITSGVKGYHRPRHYRAGFPFMYTL